MLPFTACIQLLWCRVLWALTRGSLGQRRQQVVPGSGPGTGPNHVKPASPRADATPASSPPADYFESSVRDPARRKAPLASLPLPPAAIYRQG